METLFSSPTQTPLAPDDQNITSAEPIREQYTDEDHLSKDHYSEPIEDHLSTDHYSEPIEDQFNDPEYTDKLMNQSQPSINNQTTTSAAAVKAVKPVKSSVPNHLKPNTIWHTAALPRQDQPLDLRNEYSDNLPIKKRRLEGGIEIVRCQICCQHFDSPGHLIDHLIEHDADYKYAPIYKCSYGQCNYRTDDRPSMKYHISNVHIKTNQMRVSKKYRNRKLLRPTILCNTCPMVFATEKELWDHTASCKDYRCQFCGQHFWTVEKRLAHEDLYHEEEVEEEEEDQSWAADVPESEPQATAT